MKTSPKVKKILIAGGAGFIGSALVKKFIKDECDVHIIDNLSTGSLDNLPDSTKYWFYQGSVLDLPFLERFKHQHFDLAINLASIVGMELATAYSDLTYKTCTVGTENLLSILEPTTPVLFFSSSSVYGLDHRSPVSEQETIEKENLLRFDGGKPGYACGKWEMEQLALQEAKKGRPAMIVRPFNITGPFQLSEYGMVMPRLIQQAITNAPMTVYGDGSQIRSFSCINTFVKILFQLMNQPQLWQCEHNIVNIGTETGTSITELALMIKRVANSHSEIRYIPYNDIFKGLSDVQYRVPDASYASSFCDGIYWPDLKTLVHQIYQHHTREHAN